MCHEDHRTFFAVCKDFIRYFVNEEVEACTRKRSVLFVELSGVGITYDETLHLVFPDHLNPQRLCYPVVILESTTSGRHDTQFFRFGTIVLRLVGLQLAHELDTRIYPIGLELEKIESTSDRVVARLAREVYKLRKRTSNLWNAAD